MNTVINLTHQSVVKEIESILDNYPYYPYQKAFTIPDLRQELISYVLSRIPCYHTMASENTDWLSYNLPRQPLAQQLHLENLIHQGILAIAQAKSDWMDNHVCDTATPNCDASHWFG
ncbi:MAG: hypothetical protein SAL70_01415 [Scytonema sp. PMC 1070.18]|nr:hypothetical protein [Scytonema sp. PMC 1070.18]